MLGWEKVYVCEFRRYAFSKLEEGIKIGPNAIIDSNGKVVKNVFSYYDRRDLGCFIFRG